MHQKPNDEAKIWKSCPQELIGKDSYCLKSRDVRGSYSNSFINILIYTIEIKILT